MFQAPSVPLGAQKEKKKKRKEKFLSPEANILVEEYRHLINKLNKNNIYYIRGYRDYEKSRAGNDNLEYRKGDEVFFLLI